MNGEIVMRREPINAMFSPADIKEQRAAIFLLCAIVLGAFMEVLAGTALSFARLDMPGDIYTTPDEFAWLDCAYVSAKIVGFILVPRLFTLAEPVRCLRVAIFVMAVLGGMMANATDLSFLLLLRVLQGLAGAVLLVGGQSILFQVYPRQQQPTIQLLYAIGAVVAPSGLAPPLQGWMVDSMSWSWIFIADIGIGIIAFGLAWSAKQIKLQQQPRQHLAPSALVLLIVAVTCGTYILQHGSRWNWFGEVHIIVVSGVWLAALVLFLFQQIRFQSRDSLIQLSVFDNRDFCFGFAVSFVAGFALFGSAYLLPGFTLSVLGFTAEDAGILLLPGGLMFILSLLIAAVLIQKYQVLPALTIPFGIAFVMISMWMLSGSTTESGAADMMPALLLRGLGFGLLFLSITMIALGGLRKMTIAYGSALFATGRQIGGLIGVAVLQTYMDRQSALNRVVLTSHLDEGAATVSDSLASASRILHERGMENTDAAKVAFAMLKRGAESQVAALAFNEAFFAVFVAFVVAVPLLVGLKVWLTHARVTASDEADYNL